MIYKLNSLFAELYDKKAQKDYQATEKYNDDFI